MKIHTKYDHSENKKSYKPTIKNEEKSFNVLLLVISFFLSCAHLLSYYLVRPSHCNHHSFEGFAQCIWKTKTRLIIRLTFSQCQSDFMIS